MRRHFEKTCPCCGKTYKTLFSRQVCCSRKCASIKQYGAGPRKPRESRPSRGTYGATAAERQELKERKIFAAQRRERLAKRDLDFRDSPYAPTVTVEERGGRVIETRGRVCLGWRSSGHVSHNS